MEIFEVNELKKVFEWTKRWSFLLMVLGSGIVYLTVFQHWQIYTEPLGRLRDAFSRGVMTLRDVNFVSGGDADGSGDTVSAGNPGAEVSGGNGGALPDGTANPVEDGGGENATGGTEIAPETGQQEGAAAGETVPGRPEDVVYETVEDTYFQDALFIGDSRTVGLYEYAGWEEVSTFYASTGLTVYKLFSEPIVEVEGQKQKETIEEALSKRSFSKIYLMIGINEMGTGNVDSFMEEYGLALARLRELQPEAVIYLQGIMKVTTERSGQGDYITNEGIEERNERIAQLADNEKVYYLDVNPFICDDTGGMEASYTFDGVHLKAQYVSIWKDYLKTHAVAQVMLD